MSLVVHLEGNFHSRRLLEDVYFSSVQGFLRSLMRVFEVEAAVGRLVQGFEVVLTILR